MSLRICFAASEIAPLAKTGGLADVAAALPRYLHRHGYEVRLFMPLYSSIGLAGLEATHISGLQDVPLQLGPHRYLFSLLETNLPGTSLQVLLVQCPAVFDRSSVYTDASDEHLRFLVLQHAVVRTCQQVGFAPDIVHCNDWHTALLPLLLKTVYASDRLFARTRTVLTIHNIGYQGVFGADSHQDLATGITFPEGLLDLSNQQFNWLREGIRHADRVTTVSPTYATEIRTPEGGHGLDRVLLRREDEVIGILNGVDYEEWNPATDRYLKYPFDRGNLSGKLQTKRWLLDWLNLPLTTAAEQPLLGIVSRLTSQKGFDLLFDSLPELLGAEEVYLVALGSGEQRYEEFFANLQRRFPTRAVFHRGYHEELAHLIEAGSDIFLMPSLYEPCGLNQMYSLKYGTVPIVRRTGGLADSVHMWDPTSRQGTGIVFNDFDIGAMRWALRTALDLYRDRTAWLEMMRNGMAQDFAWEQQGLQYVRLYEELVK